MVQFFQAAPGFEHSGVAALHGDGLGPEAAADGLIAVGLTAWDQVSAL